MIGYEGESESEIKSAIHTPFDVWRAPLVRLSRLFTSAPGTSSRLPTFKNKLVNFPSFLHLSSCAV